MKPLAAAAVVATLLSLSAACGNSQDIASGGPPTTTPTATGTTTPAASPTTTPPTTTPAAPPTTAPTSTSPATTPGVGSRVSGRGFSFAIPGKWEDITAGLKAQNPQLDVAVGEQNATTFRTNFNVVIASATTATIERDAAALRKEAASELTTVTRAPVTPLPDRQIDGEAAIGQTSALNRSGTSVTFLQYVTIHNGLAYPVTMTFATANAAAAKATLAAILASWRWAG